MAVQPNYDTFIDNNVQPKKFGEASSAIFFGLLGGGDAGIQAAMQKGEITKIHHIDHRQLRLLFFLFELNTTVVYGE